MTHGKKWKITTHFRHECDERSEIQDEKTRRSTVRVQKSVQIFKKMIEKFIHVSMNKGNHISQWTRRQTNWCHKKNTPPRRWSGEYFARIQHSWTRANPPVNPTCCFKEQNTIKNLSGCHRHCRMLSRTKHCLDALVTWWYGTETAIQSGGQWYDPIVDWLYGTIFCINPHAPNRPM